MKIITTPGGCFAVIASDGSEVTKPDRMQRAELRRLADHLEASRPEAAAFARRVAGVEWAVPPVC